MSEKSSFNPYQAWLGINKRNPNYFELLGISPTEADGKAIAAAAEQQLAKVRGCRPGDQQEAWSQLIDRIKRAKASLVDPAKRGAYIKKLKEAVQQARSSQPERAPASAAKPSGATKPASAAKPASVTKPARKKSKSSPQGTAGAVGKAEKRRSPSGPKVEADAGEQLAAAKTNRAPKSKTAPSERPGPARTTTGAYGTAVDSPPPGDAMLPPSGDTMLPPSGDAMLPPSGDTILPPSGDAILPPSGDAMLPPSGDAMVPAPGDAMLPALATNAVGSSEASSPPSLPPSLAADNEPDFQPIEAPTSPAAEIDPMAPVAIPIPGVDSEPTEAASDAGAPVAESGMDEPAAEEDEGVTRSTATLPRESATQRVVQHRSRKKRQLISTVLLVLALVAVGSVGWLARGIFGGGTEQIAKQQGDGDVAASSANSNSSTDNGNESASGDGANTSGPTIPDPGAGGALGASNEGASDDQDRGVGDNDRERMGADGTRDPAAAGGQANATAGNDATDDDRSTSGTDASMTETDPPGDDEGVPGTNDDPEMMADQPLTVEQIESQLVSIQQLLTDRNPQLARSQLEKLLQTELPESLAGRVARLGNLVDLIDQFWQAFDAGAATLGAGEELLVDTSRAVAIVEATDEQIVYRVGGQNQRVAPREIEPGLAKIIAEKSLEDSPIDRRLVVGAFYAVEGKSPEIAAQRAREYWEEAELMGADVRPMLEYLNDAFGEDQLAAMNLENERPDPATLEPIPDRATMERLKADLQSKFAEEIANAKTPRRRSLVVEALRNASRELSEPEDQFVYQLTMARYLAQSGQLDDAFEIAEELAQTYQVRSQFAVQVELLVAASETFVGVEYCREVAETSLGLAEAAVAAGETSDVGLLTRAATEVSEKTHDVDFIQSIQERVAALREQL